MNRNQRRRVYKLTSEEIKKLERDSYSKGFEDGTEVSNDADLKIKLKKS